MSVYLFRLSCRQLYKGAYGKDFKRTRKWDNICSLEAGTQRMRDVINKNVQSDDLMRACRTAFEAGKNQVKLYFMNGRLPKPRRISKV